MAEYPFRPLSQHPAAQPVSTTMPGDLYRPGYAYPAPHSDLKPLREEFYRPNYGLYPTTFPGLYPPMQSSTHQHHGNYRLVSTDHPTMISHRTDEYHFEVPAKDCRPPPSDHASYFRPSKMIKTEEQDPHIHPHRKALMDRPDDADDESHLYHKRPSPDTAVMRGVDILRSFRAPETTFGRLAESDFAEGTSQVLRAHNRPMLVPSGSKNRPKTRKVSQGKANVMVPKVFKASRSKLKTCQSLLDGTRVSLAHKYESDPKMKKPEVYRKLAELNTYLRQIEDGLAGALAMTDELCQP